MVVHLKSCCCGCSLKTGTVIIGIVCGIASLGALISCISTASTSTGEIQNELITELENKKDSMSPAEFDEELRDLKDPSGYEIFPVVFICLAVVYAIHLIFNILIVFGASAERPRMIKPWIVYTILLLVVQTILEIVSMIIYFLDGKALLAEIGLVMLAFGIALGVYFILVVNSFHTELLSIKYQNNI